MRLDSFHFTEVRNLTDGGHEWKLEKLPENDTGNTCYLLFFRSIRGAANTTYSPRGLSKSGWPFLVG